jgi:HSP20 family molecular chaperone IbpA
MAPPDFKMAATDKGLEISVELDTRLQRSNLRITLDGGSLKIANECTVSVAPFEKRLKLPEGYEFNKAIASFVEGVLQIRVPKKAG